MNTVLFLKDTLFTHLTNALKLLFYESKTNEIVIDIANLLGRYLLKSRPNKRATDGEPYIHG